MSYAKLRGKIREVYGTEKQFASAMGISKGTVSAKLNGKGNWNTEEIGKAINLLQIPHSEANEYFFAR